VSAQHGDLVAEHQDFDVLGRVGPGEQRQPAQHTGEHQVRESKRHSERSCWPRSGLRLRAPLGAKVLIKGRGGVLGTHRVISGITSE
jgi:hypothetical protein